MTLEQLEKKILKLAKKGNCFTQQTREILLDYKNSGGIQSTVIELLEQIKTNNPNDQTLQDGIDDILDIATGFCGIAMRVWD